MSKKRPGRSFTAGHNPLINYALPPLVKACARKFPDLRDWAALRKRYRRVVDSAETAISNAHWKTRNRAGRKLPFPANKPWYWDALKSLTLDLGLPMLQRAINAAATEYEDREFFVHLGRRLDNPPVVDPDAENRGFLIKHWLILKPSRVALVEAGPPGEWFQCGVIPGTGGKPCFARTTPARPAKEFPGLCWFTTEAVADFHASLPHAKKHDEKYWQNQIDRLGLKRPGLLLVRERAVTRETDKVTIRYRFPGAHQSTSESFPLFPEDSNWAKPAWKSSRSNPAP